MPRRDTVRLTPVNPAGRVAALASLAARGASTGCGAAFLRGVSRLALAGAAILIAACGEQQLGEDPRADPGDAARVALGAKVYAQHCAACHGARLEGQPEWRRRLPNGRLPAPPHDESGHTWHHPDHVLFAITRNGLVPPYAPQGYASDMPAFRGLLKDEEIWAALAFIKSHWKSRQVLEARAEINRQARSR
jgi:mono/diheme cytochrome c family protein